MGSSVYKINFYTENIWVLNKHGMPLCKPNMPWYQKGQGHPYKNCDHECQVGTAGVKSHWLVEWASYQIRKSAGCVFVPGMPGTFSLLPQVSDPDMDHGTCITHVPWCMPGSLTSGFLGSRWRGKRSQHFWHMRSLQFYVSGKRPMGCAVLYTSHVCHDLQK